MSKIETWEIDMMAIYVKEIEILRERIWSAGAIGLAGGFLMGMALYHGFGC